MHDLILRGGLLVDGTGAEPVTADIAIDGNEISEIGNVTANAQRVIDATDHIVTPGFVDMHTHLDAQIGWDPMLTPLTWHGVTTAVLGNCGVTFAPCRRGDPPFLAGMMETVEDIPRDAILQGLSWDWEHYGEYLDAVERQNPVINVAGLIGHCAIRYYVMGERSIDGQPTADELQLMATIVRSALEDGAIGFSTSRNPGHVIPDGRSVPGTFAQPEELIEIAKVVGNANGLMQTVMNMSEFESEMELLRLEAEHARVLFSHYTGRTSSYGNKVEAKVTDMLSSGLDVSATVIPRSSGFLTGLQSYLPWHGGVWDELAAYTFNERVAAVQDDDLVARLVDAARQREPNPAPEHLYFLGVGDKPNYVSGPSESLAAMAATASEEPAQTFIRLARDSAGKALFAWRALNQSMEALSEAITSSFCLPGLGDAGAHVSQIMDSGWATFVLTHWHRDTGLLALPEVIQKLTGAPARILGLRDRGVLQVGKKADLNVINLERLAERMPEITHDFPGGAPRFTQKAYGYRATICNGLLVLENDCHTGARAGTVLRHSESK